MLSSVFSFLVFNIAQAIKKELVERLQKQVYGIVNIREEVIEEIIADAQQIQPEDEEVCIY